MASNYQPVGSNRSVQVLGPTQVIDVEEAQVVTAPSGVYFSFPIPLDMWLQNQGADYLGTIASQIEQQISEGLAVTASYIQDVDPSGLLVDYLDFVVQYVPPGGLRGPFEGVVRMPLNLLLAAIDPFFGLGGNSPAELLSAELDRLKALAGQ